MCMAEVAGAPVHPGWNFKELEEVEFDTTQSNNALDNTENKMEMPPPSFLIVVSCLSDDESRVCDPSPRCHRMIPL